MSYWHSGVPQLSEHKTTKKNDWYLAHYLCGWFDSIFVLQLKQYSLKTSCVPAQPILSPWYLSKRLLNGMLAWSCPAHARDRQGLLAMLFLALCSPAGLLSLGSELKFLDKSQSSYREHVALAPDWAAGAGSHQSNSAPPSSSRGRKYWYLCISFLKKNSCEQPGGERSDSSVFH